jgi:hypothetical protein
MAIKTLQSILLTPQAIEAVSAILEQVAPPELNLKAQQLLVGKGTYPVLRCPNCQVHEIPSGRATIDVRHVLIDETADAYPFAPCWVRHTFMDDGRTTYCGLVLEPLGLNPDGLAPLIQGRRPA